MARTENSYREGLTDMKGYRQERTPLQERLWIERSTLLRMTNKGFPPRFNIGRE